MYVIFSLISHCEKKNCWHVCLVIAILYCQYVLFTCTVNLVHVCSIDANAMQIIHTSMLGVEYCTSLYRMFVQCSFTLIARIHPVHIREIEETQLAQF